MRKPICPLILNDAEIASVAPPLTEIVDIVAETYRLDGNGRTEVPSKIGVHPDHRNSFCHAMPAWVAPHGALGMKWVSYFPGITARGLPDSTGIILLNDPEDGVPVGILEGMWITYARTTACAVVMARTLAPTPPRTLALVGCGGLGGWMVRMAAAALPSVETVLVNARSLESSEAFCEKMRHDTGLDLQPVAQARDAVAPADLIVSSIPPPEEGFIRPEWLKPGALAVPLDYFHCYTPQAVSAMTAVFSDDRNKIGPQIERFLPGRTVPPLIDFQSVAAGIETFDWPSGGMVMALPTGIASTDMTVAWAIFRRARDAGMGVSVTLTTL